MSYMDKLSKKIKSLRVANGWSQSELAQRATISQSSIHYIESGFRKNPGIMCLQKLAEAFNVSLLDLTDSTTPPLHNNTNINNKCNT